MELLGMLIGWLMSPFQDPLDDCGRNRYWEHPDFNADDVNEESDHEHL